MDFKRVLKVYSLQRQLTDDETALLNTLRGMTDAERELLAESLGPPAKAKSTKPSTKKFKKCDVCGVSKRAAKHHDTTLSDYHVFDEGGSAKGAVKRRGLPVMGASVNGKLPTPLLCDYSIDGKVCKGTATDAIHDKAMGYGNYHPFQSAARSAESSSSTGQSEVSSEAETASAPSATGG